MSEIKEKLESVKSELQKYKSPLLLAGERAYNFIKEVIKHGEGSSEKEIFGAPFRKCVALNPDEVYLLRISIWRKMSMSNWINIDYQLNPQRSRNILFDLRRFRDLFFDELEDEDFASISKQIESFFEHRTTLERPIVFGIHFPIDQHGIFVMLQSESFESIPLRVEIQRLEDDEFEDIYVGTKNGTVSEIVLEWIEEHVALYCKRKGEPNNVLGE